MSDRQDVHGAKNLQMRVDGSVLYLYCDLSKDFGTSASGKSVLISSSSGNKPLGSSGAFLGFNVYTKSLDARNLNKSGVGALRSEDFTPVGQGCEWRIEEGSTTLCIKVDFDAATPRPGSTGKSMLLATTGGNKPVGNTGLHCGLNCYHPMDATFAVDKLSSDGAAEETLQVGQSTTIGDGFQLVYRSEKELVITYTYDSEGMADGHVASMPAYRLGDCTVTLFVSAVKKTRAKTEASGDASTASATTHAAGGGGFAPSTLKGDKVRNIQLTCTPVAKNADTYTLVFTVDPTQSSGLSASGKSMTVATTAGFQHIVNAEGQEVCRVSLNAYRPASPVDTKVVAAAVDAVLAKVPKESLKGLSFKDVLVDVMAEMMADEAMKDVLRDPIKKQVVAYMMQDPA